MNGIVARFICDERGSYLVFMALLLPALVAIAGLATEGGFWLYTKSGLQVAADNAAYSAATAYAIDSTSDLALQAQSVAADSGFVNGQNGTTVTIHKPPVGACNTTSYVGDAKSVEAVVTRIPTRLFSKMWSSSDVVICARSVAFISGGGDCLMSLGSTGTGISSNQNNLNLNLEGCSLFSNSSDANAISITGNSDSINTETIGAVGGVAMNGNSLTTSVSATTGNPPVADPYASEAAAWPKVCAGCTTYSQNPTETPPKSNIFPLVAGNYPSGIVLSSSGGTYNFAPGTYYLGGNLSVTKANITINGTGGVTLILTGNSVIDASSNNSIMNLSAPSSGTFEGVVVWEPTSTGTNNFGGNSFIANLKGIIYTPNGIVNYAGNTGTTALPSCVQIVAKSILLGGNSINISGNCASVPGFKKFGQLVALVE